MLFFRKPLNYAIALNELGSDVVHRYVGQEPSGGKFNALELDYNSERIVSPLSIAMGNDGFFSSIFTEKPHNPMVNTGSIVVSSLLQTLVIN